MPTSSAADVCLSCGAVGASGTFCSSCGAPLTHRCPGCSTALPRAARFCDQCGQSLAASKTRRTARANVRAWVQAIGAVALIVLTSTIVLIALRVGARQASTGDAAPAVQQGIVAAPDISSMSPRERASRLYDRVTRLHEERKGDSVAFFAAMALGAYTAIPDLDSDGRYDLARIAMIASALAVAQAQRDTILASDSTHLLGLLLAADLARAVGDEAGAKRFEATFGKAARREQRRGLPEYRAHAREIENAVARLGGSAEK